MGEIEWIAPILRESCRIAREGWGLDAIPGVELTHLPPRLIPEAARRAREAGLELVVVHGETPVEPVEPGTNSAALSSPHVDILGHPGILTPDEVQTAARMGIFLEITSRRGHCLANGRTAALALEHGARLVIDSDAHVPGDLWDEEFARTVLLGAGIHEESFDEILHENPRRVLERIRGSRQSAV